MRASTLELGAARIKRVADSVRRLAMGGAFPEIPRNISERQLCIVAKPLGEQIQATLSQLTRRVRSPKGDLAAALRELQSSAELLPIVTTGY